jgi:hypothetical protein
LLYGVSQDTGNASTELRTVNAVGRLKRAGQGMWETTEWQLTNIWTFDQCIMKAYRNVINFLPTERYYLETFIDYRQGTSYLSNIR